MTHGTTKFDGHLQLALALEHELHGLAAIDGEGDILEAADLLNLEPVAHGQDDVSVIAGLGHLDVRHHHEVQRFEGFDHGLAVGGVGDGVG